MLSSNNNHTVGPRRGVSLNHALVVCYDNPLRAVPLQAFYDAVPHRTVTILHHRVSLPLLRNKLNPTLVYHLHLDFHLLPETPPPSLPPSMPLSLSIRSPLVARALLLSSLTLPLRPAVPLGKVLLSFHGLFHLLHLSLTDSLPLNSMQRSWHCWSTPEDQIAKPSLMSLPTWRLVRRCD